MYSDLKHRLKAGFGFQCTTNQKDSRQQLVLTYRALSRWQQVLSLIMEMYIDASKVLFWYFKGAWHQSRGGAAVSGGNPWN